jgi:hypothetical protein
MFQVSAGTIEAFSYVQWPAWFIAATRFSKLLQLNLLYIAPLHCFNNNLKTDAYFNLIFYVAFNGSVILIALSYYQLKKLYKYSRCVALVNDTRNPFLGASLFNTGSVSQDHKFAKICI